MIANLKPGKRYEFELKTGNTLKVTIEKLEGDQLIGFHHTKDSLGRMVTNPFSDSFENLEKNTAKISVSKFDPFLTSVTVLAIAIPATYALAYAAWAVWVAILGL